MRTNQRSEPESRKKFELTLPFAIGWTAIGVGRWCNRATTRASASERGVKTAICSLRSPARSRARVGVRHGALHPHAGMVFANHILAGAPAGGGVGSKNKKKATNQPARAGGRGAPGKIAAKATKAAK